MTASIDRGASIARALLAARRRRGWSREALAYHAGLSAAAIAQIETGRRQDVRLSSLTALAAALEVTVDHLAGAGIARPLLRHRALVHDDPEEFAAGAVPFLTEALEAGGRPLAVLVPARVALLRDALGDAASRVDFRDAAAWCDTPTQAFDRYRAFLGERLEAGDPWVWILAEPGWPGDATDAYAQWMRFESIVDMLFAPAPASVLCAYDTTVVPPEVVAGARCTHPELTVAADSARNEAYRDPVHLLGAGAIGG